MSMQKVFEATVEKHGKWWIGWVDEVPGACSQGRTLKELLENLEEAVTMVIVARNELSRRSLQTAPTKRYKRKIVIQL